MPAGQLGLSGGFPKLYHSKRWPERVPAPLRLALPRAVPELKETSRSTLPACSAHNNYILNLSTTTTITTSANLSTPPPSPDTFSALPDTPSLALLLRRPSN
ncbi:hypothetical protein Q7P35_012221 [Cladosporium inversicolor]